MSIPAELRDLPQWMLWRAVPLESGKVDKQPICPHTGALGSSTDPSKWSTYEHVTAVLPQALALWPHGGGIGFAFTPDDPYVFVDLDDLSDAKDETAAELHRAIYERVVSYAELSVSGKGLHIIAKGSIPAGVRDSSRKVELYPHGRFAVMTGNVYRDSPILDCSQVLTELYGHLTAGRTQLTEHAATFDGEETQTDEQLWQSAWRAKDGAKFEALWQGKWEELGYQSQSEADQAIVNIIAFYTDNRAQVARLFLMSELGRRIREGTKKKHRNYISDMVTKSFDRKAPPIDLSGFYRSMSEELEKRRGSGAVTAHQADTEDSVKVDPRALARGTQIGFPPGLLGEIARYVFEKAPRPLAPVAMTAAIGMMAGMAGRCYTVSHNGLNQYIVLLGNPGVGKDALARGMRSLWRLVFEVLPSAKTFVGPGEIQSAQGLIKWLSENPSIVSHQGEVGHIYAEMNQRRSTGVYGLLKRTLLKLYSLSGPDQDSGDMSYSDVAKNVVGVVSPAFTWIGETTPEKFFGSIDEAAVSEGLIPRLLILENPVKRPEVNPYHVNVKPSPQLVDGLCQLAAQCLTMNTHNRIVEVGFDAEADALLGLRSQFSHYCDQQYDAAERDVQRDLWGRAWMKAAKLAALAAVGCNYANPVINRECAQWAIDIVLQDVNATLSRFMLGEVLMNGIEGQQIQRLTDTVKEWYLRPWREVKSYAEGLESLHSQKIVPYSFIARRNMTLACFRSDKWGATGAIKRAVKQLVDRGDLEELPEHVLKKTYGFGGVAYIVRNLHTFNLGS